MDERQPSEIERWKALSPKARAWRLLRLSLLSLVLFLVAGVGAYVAVGDAGVIVAVLMAWLFMTGALAWVAKDPEHVQVWRVFAWVLVGVVALAGVYVVILLSTQ